MMTKAKKRKNKLVPLVILLGVLVVLWIAYAALAAANDRREAEEAAALEAENAVLMIAEYDANTTASLTYSRRGEDGHTFLLDTTKGWSYAADAQFPVNQTMVSQMAAAIAQIGVETTVTEGTAADYGLDDPAYTMSITYQDGVSHNYAIGAYNSFNDAYYFSADGELYMVASGLVSYFDYALEDLLALDTLPTADWADLGYITSVTVTADGKTNTITDDAGKEALLDALGAVTLTECTDYYADDAEKAVYGLDGTTSVAVKYKKAVQATDANGNETTNYLETTYTLVIGAPVGHNDGYYVSPSSSKLVYTVPEATVLALTAYADYAAE